jgi:serine/threonine protein kinase
VEEGERTNVVRYELAHKQRASSAIGRAWRGNPFSLIKRLRFYFQRSDSSVGKSTLSGGSFDSKANNRLSAKQAIANGVRCSYKRYQQTRNINFPKNDLSRLKELKLVENENLNKFYGMCFNQQNEVLVLWLLCQRGSLEDVLFNEELKISRNFQVSFAKDVVKGVFFLHSSLIKTHGFLCLQNCLVDSNWSVKLTNFVTEEIISDKLKHNELKPFVYKAVSTHKKKQLAGDSEPEENGSESAEYIQEQKNAEKSDRNDQRKFIQQAPEVVRELITTKFLPPATQAADIYSLGMVIYQVLFKTEPFAERGLPPNRVLEMIALSNDNEQIARPVFPSQHNTGGAEAYNLQLLSAIEACWLEVSILIPSFNEIVVLDPRDASEYQANQVFG